ncbi:hypothetical protein D9757_007326 [Collybiopsis confluens]|uniref:Protein BNI4 n=1 Tax=Collybiopsis confluens TaxID=2823264 RepID=A0A8H5HGD9_9AGAR|nr:hypothetical protein D9757_007326 [Collybiopsis confluens]
MAVLAPSDWHHFTRDDSQMDIPSNNSRQQRSSPANDPASQPASSQSTLNPAQLQQINMQQPQQQPYPFAVQQQPQGSWTPSISAQPFYPSFYQNHQNPPQAYPQLPQQPPYFDPANAQLAQWAYQQMMFNAQQQGFMPQPPQNRTSPQSRQSPSPQEYFGNAMFNPFPSGTPPPPPQQQQQGGQYPGFHPYRRPARQGSSPQSSHPPDASNDWRPAAPPYARPDASGSSSSVNSTNSHQRQRTNSNQSGHSGHNTPPGGSTRSRNGSTAAVPQSTPSATVPARSSPSGSLSSSSSANSQRNPHHRNLSSSSSASSSPASSRTGALSPPTPPTTSATPSSASSSSAPRLARPSPLSQGTFTAAEKRMSRDDSDLAAMLESSTPNASLRSSGIKGRLRRALNFNAQQSLKEEGDDDDDASIKASALNSSSSKLKPKSSHLINTAVGKSNSGGVPSPDVDDAESTATVQTKKKSRAASLFNSRLNASTDNISLSSTVSSASVMIRKLGSMGKLARRNSLAGITSLFKDKEKKNKDKETEEGGESSDKKGKKKKSAKAEASEASISHVTAELDRSPSNDWGGPEMSGLSPAAKLARQHTLKTNAEAAAKAKAQQEAAAAAVVAAKATNGAKTNGNAAGGGGGGVPTWERNTQTRQGSASPVKGGGGFRTNEDGTRVLIEDDDEDRSDDERFNGAQSQGAGEYHPEGWDDDEEWDGEDDEDVTIRLGMERASMDEEVQYDEADPWATDVRRSVERKKVPTKGILKYATTYDQQNYMAENITSNRVRSNSYNSHPSQQSELGPLAHIPSPDPDHIDGLHRHGSHSSGHGTNSNVVPTIPPLSFEPTSPIRASIDSPRNSFDSPHAPHPPEKSSALMFSHSNSSAPALSTMSSAAPTLTHRSATTPSKRLAFANNLSVYDTFSATVYDRRSEPATWSRLTPALAQRIKEELNSYKMEEMEVHAASRIHTQFFV